MSFLMVFQSRKKQSKVEEGLYPPNPPEKGPFLPLLPYGSLGHVVVCASITATSVSVFTWLSYLHVCPFILHEGHSDFMLEKTLESPLDCKEIQPVHPKGDQSWVFIRRTDAEAEALILWPPDVKSWLIWKDPDAGKDWGQEEKGTTEDEMVGWHHWPNGPEFEQTPGDGEGQGRLACCSLQGHKELDTTEQLNNNLMLLTSSQVRRGCMISS